MKKTRHKMLKWERIDKNVGPMWCAWSNVGNFCVGRRQTPAVAVGQHKNIQEGQIEVGVYLRGHANRYTVIAVYAADYSVGRQLAENWYAKHYPLEVLAAAADGK